MHLTESFLPYCVAVTWLPDPMLEFLLERISDSALSTMCVFHGLRTEFIPSHSHLLLFSSIPNKLAREVAVLRL